MKKWVVKKEKDEEGKLFLPHLAICIVMDLLGMATYALPQFGEFADLLWAPLSGFLFYKFFGGRLGMIGGIFDFLEELIPFTDFIPSFTIAWFIRKRQIDKLATKSKSIRKIK